MCLRGPRTPCYWRRWRTKLPLELLGKAKAGWGNLGRVGTLDELAAGAGYDEKVGPFSLIPAPARLGSLLLRFGFLH